MPEGAIAFRFSGPGIQLGSDQVRVEMVDGLWSLSLDDPYPITVEHESQDAALLMLIARRCGFEAELWRVEDDEPQETP